LSIALAVPVSAQQPALKITARVSVRVDAEGDALRYRYFVDAAPDSGSIAFVEIDLPQPEGGARLSSDGLPAGAGALPALAVAPIDWVAVTPSTPSAPPGWVVGFSKTGTVLWVSGSPETNVRGNASVGGFSLLSRGIPGLRRLTLKPYVDPDDLEIPPPTGDDDLERFYAAVDQAQKSFEFSMITLGPTAPPAVFDPGAHLNAVVAYTNETLNLGWLRDGGLYKSITQKLSAARQSFERGQFGAGKGTLEAALAELVAQEGKGIDGEGVALLRENILYLLSGL
jgi:hypothetical protein